jgi:hypothetical protein
VVAARAPAAVLCLDAFHVVAWATCVWSPELAPVGP